MPSRRSSIMAALLVGVAAIVPACSSDDAFDPGSDLASRLVPGDGVPTGFTVVPAQVSDLIESNRSALDAAKTVAFSPAECAPTADAEFNPALTEDNTVLLAAQSDTSTFSELISTVRRNVDADRRDTSGPCRVVTATPSTGTLAGVPIVNTSTELRSLHGDHVEQSYLLRTDSVKRPANGAIRFRTALLANVLVKRPDGAVLTVQIGVSNGEQTAPAGTTPDLTPPITEAAFVDLVRAAVDRAAS